MLCVLPAGGVRLDEPLGSRSERNGLRGINTSRGFHRALGFDGIAAVQSKPPSIAGLDPSVRKANVARRTKPMPSAAAIALEPKQPRPAAAFGNLQV
jgi:hypothetical protein